MKNVVHLALLAALLGSSIGLAAAAQAVRPEVGQPLQEAQLLLQGKKYREALDRIEKAARVAGLDAHERYLVERLRAAAATGAGDYIGAVRAYEQALASTELPDAERLHVLDAIGRLAYAGKQYGKAATAIQDYRTAGGDSVETLRLLPQALYLADRHVEAARELSAQIAASEKAGKAPGEAQLQLLGSIALKRGDDAGYRAALEKLVTHYPKDSYWQDLIARTANQPGFSDRLALDLYRLRSRTGTLDKAGEYLEATQLALQAGLPGEAKQFLDAGYRRGLLGTGAATDVDRHKRLSDLVAKRVAEDQQTFAEGETAAAAKASGDALVATGLNYVGYGQFDRGIPLIEQGLAKGQLTQESVSRLHLGYAYLRAGKKQEAIRTFQSIQGSGGAADLSALWLVQVGST
ncbi:hypothetical protein DFR24_1074 [Panacagrimonas perspica]|uniref:Tetratricopeptide repeat protein n=1 Tax=Panacagrimonas perspica TaxID=381431 RepID=A0A4S3K4T4_9GAMM|nr:tetratricopeptide repeat protein [Panacagrimonas perspica]TDU31695.1 hypothetical protein DFR24_1074 [Panacagrimonas perspica]THD03089.1 hypothetical protein B1810_10880 [Panacagrimonas perspica]